MVLSLVCGHRRVRGDEDRKRRTKRTPRVIAISCSLMPAVELGKGERGAPGTLLPAPPPLEPKGKLIVERYREDSEASLGRRWELLESEGGWRSGLELQNSLETSLGCGESAGLAFAGVGLSATRYE